MARILLLFIGLVAFANIALASSVSVRGGGHGVLENGRVTLLDFYERGFTSSSSAQPVLRAFRRPPLHRVFIKNSPFRSTPIAALESQIEAKLFDVSIVDPVFAAVCEKAIQSLRWSFVVDELKPVEADSEIKRDLVQVALRTGNRVIINEKLWRLMPRSHQVGLIFHEVVSSVQDRSAETFVPARILTADLFDESVLLGDVNSRSASLLFFPSVSKLLKVKEASLIPEGDLLFRYSEAGFSVLPIIEIARSVKDEKGEKYETFESLSVTRSNQSWAEEKISDCETLRKGQVKGVSYYDREIELRLAVDSEAGLEPRFTWKLSPGRQIVVMLPACDSTSLTRLSAMNSWLNSLARRRGQD